MFKYALIVVGAIASILVGACQIAPSEEATATPEATAETSQAIQGCSCDSDCNDGSRGSQRVCSNSGAEAGTCIWGCHSDWDCPSYLNCNQDGPGHWYCEDRR